MTTTAQTVPKSGADGPSRVLLDEYQDCLNVSHRMDKATIVLLSFIKTIRFDCNLSQLFDGWIVAHLPYIYYPNNRELIQRILKYLPCVSLHCGIMLLVKTWLITSCLQY